MGRMMLGIDNTITFKSDTHQYFDNTGAEYKSVTRILNSLKIPFDKKIAGYMAITIAKETGVSVEQARITLLAEWEQKGDSSRTHGTLIHNAIESYLKKGKSPIEMPDVIAYMRDLVRPYYRYYSETILYDQTNKIAGQTDLIIQRQKSEDSLYDFYDYKTNESKGIQFDSISRKAESLKHCNRNLLSPLSHLEDCNYTLYSLQLSIYAYLAQVTYGINVGRLGIIFISKNFQITSIPVPYMKMEAQLVVEHMVSLNPLPVAVKMIVQKVVSKVEYSDDWD